MTSRPWPYTDQLVNRMADSSLQDTSVVSARQRSPRSAGLHASTLLKMLHPVTSSITDEALRIYGLLGLAFEDRAELALLSLSRDDDWPWYGDRSGEVERDGIACSPDILLAPKSGDGNFLELSLKLTWKSSKDAPTGDKFTYYLDQCLTYCTPLQTAASVLLVYFVNGDYSFLRRGGSKSSGGPPQPLVRGYELTFTRHEREEMWATLLHLKKKHQQSPSLAV